MNGRQNGTSRSWHARHTSPISSADHEERKVMRNLSPLIWFTLSTSNILVYSLTFYVKTKETFKLADVQLADLRLTSDCRRIALDAATGSSLIAIECSSSADLQSKYISRYEWTGKAISEADSPEELIENLRNTSTSNLQQWSLGYWRATAFSAPHVRHFTKTSILHTVAQALQAPASLNPKESSTHLCLVDTLDWTGGKLVLLQIHSAVCDSSWINTFKKQWAVRPFAYSAALNPQLAEMIIDMLSSIAPNATTLLDPTCGSGTLLAQGLLKGTTRVIGFDTNPQCVEGSLRNLHYMVSADGNVDIQKRDATLPWENVEIPSNTVVASNLPWGLETVLYRETIQGILARVATHCPPRTPCAFVSKQSVTAIMSELGYQILDEASVPPAGFHTPTKKGKAPSVATRTGRADCLVTIARTRS